jgi:hypothetical protein
MTTPSADDLWEGEGYDEICDELYGSWRWGTIRKAVYRRLSDDTCWMCTYWLHSQDGRNCGMDPQVCQVVPHEETIVVRKWKPVTENSNA